MRSHQVSTGRYIGTNAYGARSTVQQCARTTIGILERPAQGWEDLFFADRQVSDPQQTVIARVPVDPALAADWRLKLRAAVLIEPKPPFMVHATKDWGPPRLDKLINRRK